MAGKIEEQEINIPKVATLKLLAQPGVSAPGFSARDFMSMEMLLLQAFDWHVAHPTAAHFLDHYVAHAVCASDVHNSKPLGAKCHRARDFVLRYCAYFLEVSLQGENSNAPGYKVRTATRQATR